MKKIYKLLLLILIITCSCDSEIKYEYDKKVVLSKREMMEDGSTTFVFSFTDGSSDNADFGIYETYEPGDTMCVRRCTNCIIGRWGVIDCEEYKEELQ